MKKLLPLLLGAMCLPASAASLEPAQISGTLKRVADWQLAHPSGTNIREWVIAPLYDGLIDTSEATGDPKYLASVLRLGMQSGWEPGNAVYFADDHAVGHAWLDIHAMDPSRKERLEPFRKRFDFILANPIGEKLIGGRQPKTPGVGVGDRWTWCDALFMAPPALARLAKATGDTRYLDFLDAEYKVTYDDLYDHDENLFYRDDRFIGQKTPNGAKVFWSRGNGWVFAGLPMLLEALPGDHKTRKFYENLLQRMAPAVLASQQPDGLWRPSLLDAEQIPVGETSGSAFYIYGLAWGVRHGLLDRGKYWPAIEKGWNALLTRIEPDGAVGYVQRIGDAPDSLNAKSRQLYGTGGVLMAGSELLRGLGAAADVKPADLLAQAEKLVAEDRTPRAWARFVPERKDDLAWENDRAAYRVYGPGLRDGVEAGGIDAWAKRGAAPVIFQWYADDLAGRRGYHEDHGEGYDGYKVGDAAGCGGIGIWHGGKLVMPEVFDEAMIVWTAPDVAEFHTRYTYPPIEGKTYREERVTKLRSGEDLNTITSRFRLDAPGHPPAAGLEVAIGLAAQTPDAEVVMERDRGVLAVWDKLPGGEAFGIGAVVETGSKMSETEHSGTPKVRQPVAILRTNSEGGVSYRAGFGWSGGDKGPQSKDEWLGRLQPLN